MRGAERLGRIADGLCVTRRAATASAPAQSSGCAIRGGRRRSVARPPAHPRDALKRTSGSAVVTIERGLHHARYQRPPFGLDAGELAPQDRLRARRLEHARRGLCKRQPRAVIADSSVESPSAATRCSSRPALRQRPAPQAHRAPLAATAPTPRSIATDATPRRPRRSATSFFSSALVIRCLSA